MNRKFNTDKEIYIKLGQTLELLGVSCQQYQKYEKGHNKLPVNALYKLSQEFEITVDDLINNKIVIGGHIINISDFFKNKESKK